MHAYLFAHLTHNSKSLTELNKKQKRLLNGTSVQEFVATTSKRDNPAAWLTEVELNVKSMRKTLGLASTNPCSITPTPATPDLQVRPSDITAKLQVPEWLKVTHKSKRIRALSR